MKKVAILNKKKKKRKIGKVKFRNQKKIADLKQL